MFTDRFTDSNNAFHNREFKLARIPVFTCPAPSLRTDTEVLYCYTPSMFSFSTYFNLQSAQFLNPFWNNVEIKSHHDDNHSQS